MSEKAIFTDNLDNVTIKLNEEEHVVVDGTVELVENYNIPEETDTHYTRTMMVTMRHRDSGATWVGYMYKLTERSAPVSERLHDMPTFNLQNVLEAEQGKITIQLEDKVVFSAVDDSSFYLNENFDYNQLGDKYNLSDYPSAKVFNEQNSSRTFDIVSHKRYSKGEGHPVIEVTTIQVPYPTLPYLDNLYTLVLKKNGDLFRFSTNYETDDRILEKLIVEQKPTLAINFQITLEDETTHFGVINENLASLTFAVPTLEDYAKALNKTLTSPVKSLILTPDGITISGFEGRFAITFDPYSEGIN